jgi:hypothetical protein
MANEPTELSPNLLTALGELVTSIPSHQGEYAVIGGIAVGLRARLRYTEDIDLLLRVPQLRLPGLLEDLQRRGFTLDEMDTIREWNLHHMVVIDFRGVRVDWLKPVLPAYNHVIDRATVERWRGRELRTASTEALILLKLTASRTHDIGDIETLLASHQGRLDMNWIEQEWQTMFPTTDSRWRKFQELVPAFYEQRS